MRTKIDDLFLSESGSAIDRLGSVATSALIPFLKAWWPGHPIPQEADIKRLRGWVEANVSGRTSVEYAWLSEFLGRIAATWRFNTRNFINIHPSPMVPPLLAGLAVTIQNPNNVVSEVSGPTTEMEKECIEFIARDVLKYPDPANAWGHVVSGGTVGNMTALLVARDYTYHKLARPRVDEVGARGVISRKPGVVLSTAAAHYSLKKALWFLGIGYENLIQVPVAWDEAVEEAGPREERFLTGITNEKWGKLVREAYRHDRDVGIEELRKFYAGEQCPFSLQPLGCFFFKHLYSCFEFNTPLLAVVLSLGTTHTGTVERIHSDAINHLKEEDIYVHLDGAFGGFALASDKVRSLVGDLAMADSVTLDGHKLGFLPYPCGTVVFRDRGLYHQLEQDAPYLDGLEPTLEGSRPGSHVATLWAAIQTLGVPGWSDLIDRLLTFTTKLTAALSDCGDFQILHKVDLNAVAFTPKPRGNESRRQLNSLCAKLKERVNREGRFVVNFDKSVSGVKVRESGRLLDLESPIVDLKAVRIVVSNPLVQDADSAALVDTLCRQLHEIRRDGQGRSG